MIKVKFNFDGDSREINYEAFSKGETWNGSQVVYVDFATFSKIKDILFDIDDMNKSDILDEFHSFVSRTLIHKGEVLFSLQGFCVHIVAKQIDYQLWEQISN